MSASTAPTALLAAWEASATPAQLAAQAPHQAGVLAWLTALRQLLGSTPPRPANVDMNDVATIIRGASDIRATQTETYGPGPGRAAAALRQLLAALPAAVGDHPARCALLCIITGPAASLEMDEVCEITEGVHTTLLHDEGEMIFGHDEQATVATGAIQVWLLLAY